MKIRRKTENEGASLRHEQSQLLTTNNDFFVREAYKSLRTNVMFSLTEDKENQVIMVTSSMPSEGKSTTSVNLALSLSEAGKKTLLIDCDMRKPKIGRLLKIKNPKGLSDALFNKDKSESVLSHITNTELYVLPAGSIPPNPSELLGSKRMKNLVDSLRESFDYIILDMPPINVVTDAVVASPLADGVLMVVRSGVSERNAVLRAMDLLERANAKILGVVLTCVKRENRSYGGYHNKNYGYENAGAE